jgi:hypothetical protein
MEVDAFSRPPPSTSLATPPFLVVPLNLVIWLRPGFFQPVRLLGITEA